MGKRDVSRSNENLRCAQYKVAVAVGVRSLVVPYSPNRKSLVISHDGGGLLFLNFQQSITGSGGVFQYISGPPLMFNCDDHGDLVQGPLFGFSTVGAVTVTVWETLGEVPVSN